MGGSRGPVSIAGDLVRRCRRGEQGADPIGTLVERSTRYVMLVALPDGTGGEAVRKALAKTVTKLPTELRRSITWDRGHEMNEHARFTVDTGVQISFCDPRSPWQTGVPGHEDQMRAPMVCCARSSPRVPSSRATPRHI